MGDRWVNRDAVEWVLYEADVAVEQRFTLLVVASFANVEGRGAYPAQALIGRMTGRSRRKTVDDLAALVRLGQLLPGDWRLVVHIRSDRRPNVYDLPDKYRVWLSRKPVDNSARGAATAPRGRPRGARSDTNGVQGATERGAATAHEEFLKNSGRRAPGAAQPPAAPPNGTRKWCGRCASPTRRFTIADSGAVTTQPCPTCGASANKSSTEEETGPAAAGATRPTEERKTA